MPVRSAWFRIGVACLLAFAVTTWFCACTFPVHRLPADVLGQRVAPTPPPEPEPAETAAPGDPGTAVSASGEDQGKATWAQQVYAPDPPTSPITLQEAIVMARRYSPRLRVLRERLTRAEGGEQIAFAAFLPEAAISYRALWGSDKFVLPTVPSLVGNMAFGETADSFQSAELNLQWIVWDFGRTPGRYHQARAEKEIVALQYQRGIETLVFNTTAAFFTLLQRQAMHRVAREAVVRAESFLRDARNYLAQGTAVRDDVLQAELLLAEMQLDLVSTRTGVTVALADLNRVMGVHVGSLTEVTDETEEPEFSLPLDSCLRQAVESRDEFKSVLKSLSSSQWGLAATQARFLPRIIAGATGAHHEGHAPKEANFLAGGVKIELALFEGTRRCGELKTSRAAVREAMARAEEVADTITFEVVAAYAGIKEARERIRYGRVAVTRGEENLDVLNDMFARGDATSTDVVDAEWALLRARENYYAALYGYRIALARLDYAVGVGGSGP